MSSKECILVTGGLGYIGCHIVVKLHEAGYDVIILDNLSNTSKDVLSILNSMLKTSLKFYETDMRDKIGLEEVFKNEKITGIIHLAAKKSVPESVNNPIDYYENNVIGTMNLIQISEKYKVEKFIFSSSASVYGDLYNVCKESDLGLSPVSPYACTKLSSELILRNFCESTNTKHSRVISLRYFNPVGAHQSGLIGDFSKLTDFSNLFKVIESVVNGQKKSLSIFGTDYNTIDGTPVRDYIHIEDIAEGHVIMLKYFDKETFKYDVFNMGTEKGYSVKEVIEAYMNSNKIKFDYNYIGRRPGDVESIRSDCSKIKKAMGWSCKRSLDDMCKDSYRWATQYISK